MELVKQRFEVLDAFRGIAAIIVAIFHYTINGGEIKTIALIANGHRFVDFFFVLSGFIIFSKYGDLKAYGALLKFGIKRFLRLYPLHLFMLLCFLFFEITKAFLYKHGYFNKPAFSTNSWDGFIQNLLMLQGFESSSKDFTWNYPSWSISVEFFTYLLFGAIIYAVNKIFSKGHFIALGGVVIVTLCLLSMNVFLNFHYFFKCVYGFFLGGLIFILFEKRLNIFNNLTLLGWIEGGVFLGTILAICYLPKNYDFLLVPLYGIVVFVFAFDKGIVSTYFKQPLLILMGKLSYSIYMTHALIASVLTVLYNNLLKVSSFYFDISILSFLCIVILVSYFTNKFIENRGTELYSLNYKF